MTDDNIHRHHHLPNDDDVVDAPVMSVAHLYGGDGDDHERRTTTVLEDEDDDDEDDDMERYAEDGDSFSNAYHQPHRCCCSSSKLFWVMMILMGLVVITLGTVVGMTIHHHRQQPANQMPQDDDDLTKVTTPTNAFLYPFQSLEEYYEHVLQVVELSNEHMITVTNMNHWTDPNKPQYYAMQHLVYQDAANGLVVKERESIEQRLAMLLLYFHTGGQKQTWANTEWIQPAVHECKWEHVACTAHKEIATFSGNATTMPVVTHLRLNAQASMTEALPVEAWAWLPHLQELDVSQNRLSGSIPWTLWQLKELRVVNLSKNNFEGSLPFDVRGMSTLTKFSVADNLLTGPLPLYLPMSTLEYFLVDFNQLTGTIPESWWNVSNNDVVSSATPPNYPMIELNVRFNSDLTGTMPTQIGLLTSLKSLAMKRCFFEGTIPTEVGRLSSLETFSIPDNRFSGKFPFREILKLPRLFGLTLGENDLSGTIPGDILEKYTAKYQRLTQWNMVYNSFSGTLPTELGLVKSLEWVQFNNNQFTGDIPLAALEQAGWHNQVKTFWLNGNGNLDGTMPCGDKTFSLEAPGVNDGRDWRADCFANPDLVCECCNLCK